MAKKKKKKTIKIRKIIETKKEVKVSKKEVPQADYLQLPFNDIKKDLFGMIFFAILGLAIILLLKHYNVDLSTLNLKF